MNSEETRILPTMPPLLSLNETSLLFVPSSQENRASVSQVTVTSKKKRDSSVEVLARYYLVQHQISALLADVLVLHREQPLPTKCLFIGDGYTLLAERKTWKLGEKWQFRWGSEEIEPAKDKWTFTFQLSDS
ncbi:hypothetical protein K439DRAFT_262333 [Ramaria rubella]|nr:hypothetical protein K439DRAFT_262333 [Ramaria rubella]